jgi:PAT family beta-lactamase induction signal transducer AmpG
VTTPSYLDVFRDRRITVILFLGFSSGLPIALCGGTLQAWLADSGVDIKTIGLLTLVGLPYTVKFLWAPLMDRFVPRLLGRRRGWVALCQLMVFATLLIMGGLSPSQSVLALALLALVLAYFSASQDIAFDAYRTDVLRKEERGAGAAVSVLGYRIAMLVSGGLALVLADSFIGWRATYGLMAGLMLVGAAATWFAPEPEVAVQPPRTLAEAVIGPLRDFFAREGAILALLVIVLYKLGDAFAGSLTTAFLIRGAGFSVTEVGAINKILGLVATIVGALAGGALMTRLSLYGALMLFGVLQMASNVGFWWLASAGKGLLPGLTIPPFDLGFVELAQATPVDGGLLLVIAAENISGGMGTAAFVALLMALCNQRFTATQFALLSAFASVGRVWVGPLAGVLAEAIGWPAFFVVSTVLAAPALVMLWWLRAPVRALEPPPDTAVVDD